MANKITLVGRFTKDPEINSSMGGFKKTQFSIASKSKAKDESGDFKTDFFTCTAWRERAETIANFCKKGDLVYIVGYMTSRDYEDKDGTKKTFWEVNVEDIEFLTSKAERMSATAVAKGLTPIDDGSDDNLPF